MANSGSDAGDRKDGSKGGTGGPGDERSVAAPRRTLPPPPARQPPAPPPAIGTPKPGALATPPADPSRASLTDFDMPTRERPGVAPKAAPAPGAASSLLDIDIPTRERAALPARQSRAEPPPAPMDATDDSPLEVPSGAGAPETAGAFTSSDSIGMLDQPTSEPRTVELEMPPEVAAACEAATSEPAPAADPVGGASDDSFLSSASLKADEARAAVAENAARIRREREAEEKAARERARQARQPESVEQKRQRMLLRLRTVREGVRLLGFMGIPNSAHAELDEALVELEAVMLPDADPAEARPSPDALDAAFQTLDSAALDQMERPLTQLEDLALQVDASVTRDVFRGRAFSGKHSRKTLTRYGRLLASRRFSADSRRDRFEALAMHLLTQADDTGRLVMLPKEQSRAVLQHLIGGLPQLGAERDREDALTYLKDALARLAEFPTAEEFFESGFFLDVHGYKVSMRDQLTNPDFLYLSALLSARIHNRLEAWIAEKEKDLRANQLAQDGGPRARIMGMLREQEETVQSIFGADTATVTRDGTGARRAAPRKAAKEASGERESEKDKWRKRKAALAAKKSGEPAWWQKAPVLIGVIVVSALIVLRSTGNLEVRTRSPIDADTLNAVSPLLIRGYVSDARHEFMGELKLSAWRALDDKTRHQVAQQIAHNLSQQGFETAELKAFHDVVIRIDAHLVAYVQEAKR